MEHIESKNSSESKLQTGFICFIIILNTLEAIVKIAKCSTLARVRFANCR